MPRKIKLQSVGNTNYTKLVRMHEEGIGDIMCWRDTAKVCTSDCAAWILYKKLPSDAFLDDKAKIIIKCMALSLGNDTIGEADVEEKENESN